MLSKFKKIENSFYSVYELEVYEQGGNLIFSVEVVEIGTGSTNSIESQFGVESCAVRRMISAKMLSKIPKNLIVNHSSSVVR